MIVWQNSEMLDAALNWLKDKMDTVYICSSLPKTYKEVEIFGLGSANHIIANPPEDYENGRKITVPAKNGITMSKEGDGSHYALVDSKNKELLYACPLSKAKRDLDIGDKINAAILVIRLKYPVKAAKSE